MSRARKRVANTVHDGVPASSGARMVRTVNPEVALVPLIDILIDSGGVMLTRTRDGSMDLLVDDGLVRRSYVEKIGMWRYAATPKAYGARRHDNPSVRYAAVPVDENDDGRNDVAYIVRGRRKKDAILDVAREVDADAWIDLDHTRTFATKHEAETHARAVAPRVASLYRRVARGGD